jgi:hypothetical protein
LITRQGIEGDKEMTASQTTIPAKRSSSLTGPIAVVAVGLMVAVIGVAISARPVAAPASAASTQSAPLTTGHDEARQTFLQSAPLTQGHDEARPFQGPTHKHVPQKAPSYYRVQPTYPTVQPTDYSGPHFRGK